MKCPIFKISQMSRSHNNVHINNSDDNNTGGSDENECAMDDQSGETNM